MSYKSNLKTRIMVGFLCIAMVFTTVNLPVFAIGVNAEEINEETYIGSEETNAESDVKPVEEDSLYEDADESAADETAEYAADDVTDEASEEKTGEDSEAVSEEIIEDGICGSSVDSTPAKDNSTGEYIITSAEELKWFADYIATTSNSAKARLNNSIELPGTADYANLMIGSKDKPFAGTFDGNGNTISNVNINSMLKSGSCSYAGLFAYVAGTNANHAVIKNLTVEGSISLTKSSQGAGGTENYVGGIIGTAYAYTDVDNVESRMSITANMGAKAHIGGIVGSAEWNNNPGGTPINISRASFSGKITTNCTEATGGIIGYIQKGKITDCINTGTITSSVSSGNVSGILGYINNDTSGSFVMKNCVSAGSVSGGDNTVAFVCYKNCPSSMFSSLYYDNTKITKSAYVRLEGGSNISSSSIVARSSVQMSSGAVTWALNGSKSSGDLVWYQRLGENGDPYPSLRKAEDGSNTVYYSYADCEADEKTYSNNEGLSTKQDGHSAWSNGVCGICGYECAHGSWSNGVCETCGYVCTHSSWNNGVCETCGYACTHSSWNNGVCGVCGYACTHSSWTNNVCETCGYECPHSSWSNGVCGVCGYKCAHDSWENVKCSICGYECAHGSWSNGVCETCGYECVHSSWKNGVCEICGYECTHSSWKNNVCETCGYECTHNLWSNGVCETCGYECPHESVNGDYCAKCGQSLIISVSYSYPIYNTDDKPASGIKEWKNGTQNCRIITASSTTLGEADKTTWYVVNCSDLTIDSTITVNGDVNIILADGAKLTVYGSNEYAGIQISGDGNSLTIYGQSEGKGQLISTGDSRGAGIGGGYEENVSNITINGGIVTATGGKWGGAGIGGGRVGNGNNITINGGIVTATGNLGGAGIGGGRVGIGNNITINGGTVTATGGDEGAGIGGGRVGSDITINGGIVTATGNLGGAGIGGGGGGEGSDITINGGIVTATGGDDGFEQGNSGAGIGGGQGRGGSNITINGGTVEAKGNGGGAGIGGGNEGSGSNITINGGEVTATGGDYGAGIGGGSIGSGSNITINGGTVEAKGNGGGAGIGGGQGRGGSNITINGGTVEAKGNGGGAGIGGGSSGSNITIDNKLYLYAGDNRASAQAITPSEDLNYDTYRYVYVGSIVAFYEGCSLSLSGDIGIDIYIKLNEATAENSNTKLNVWNRDKLTEISVPSNTTNVEGSDYYVFHYSIPAADYNTELKARIVCGDASGFIFTIRVADYIDYIQANESGKYDDATVNLVNAMEKYCEEAASYFAGNIEAAQYDFAAIAGELGSYKVNASDMGEGYLGTSLILNGKVTIRHYYIDNAVFAQIGVTGYKSVGDIYYYEIENISPADYDAVQANGYSVYSYILAGLSNDECSYNFKNLLCAMYEYSVAAEVYVSNN